MSDSANPQAASAPATGSQVQDDTTSASVPPASAPPEPVSEAFMARVKRLLAGEDKPANATSEWLVGQIKAAVADQQQSQQQLSQLAGAQSQAKSASDIAQGRVAALLPVLAKIEGADQDDGKQPS